MLPWPRMADEEKDSKDDPFAKFSKENLKFGSRFRSGEDIQSKRFGLAGAFRELRDPKRSAGDNLSEDDVKKFSAILAAELKDKDVHSAGFDRAERTKLRYAVDKMRRSGHISAEDAVDFKRIIDRLSA